MSKIKIKNFGPIKEGFGENWIDIEKVTLFIGNQGSGKSTVAKLISTFMWIEKALIRGDINSQISNKEFLELLRFHRVQEYLQPNTEIEYKGAAYQIKHTRALNSDNHFTEVMELKGKAVKLPKISYVPAERNFLSSIENINKVSNLIVGSLQNYSVEFRNAQLTNKGKTVELPINDTKIIYDAIEDENYIVFNKKRLKLSHASSGFHSIVPLHWVTKYLTDFVMQDEKTLLSTLSTDQNIRRNNELNELNTPLFSEKEIKEKEKKINEKYVCKYLINIVEEPEQNLFPLSQWELLKKLFEYNNLNKDNKLIMTSHSPYLVNFISIAIQAKYLKEKINGSENSTGLIERMEKIISRKSLVSASDVVVYQLNESNGTIKKLPNQEGIPSDKNYLNQSLRDGNEMFDNLLEIEQEL